MKQFKVYRPVFIYGFLTVAFVMIILFLGSYLISTLSEINVQKTNLSQDVDVLTSRLAVLKDLPSAAPNGASITLTALPSENNSLVAVSQLRRIATENEITIKNLDLAATLATGTTLPSVLINFDFEGTAVNAISFIASITKIAPLMVIDTVSLQSTADGNGVTAIMGVRTQWADLPTELPAITEPIAALTDEEQLLLSQLSELNQPVFGQGVESSESASVGKADPFTVAQ